MDNPATIIPPPKSKEVDALESPQSCNNSKVALNSADLRSLCVSMNPNHYACVYKYLFEEHATDVLRLCGEALTDRLDAADTSDKANKINNWNPWNTSPFLHISDLDLEFLKSLPNQIKAPKDRNTLSNHKQRLKGGEAGGNGRIKHRNKPLLAEPSTSRLRAGSYTNCTTRPDHIANPNRIFPIHIKTQSAPSGNGSHVVASGVSRCPDCTHQQDADSKKPHDKQGDNSTTSNTKNHDCPPAKPLRPLRGHRYNYLGHLVVTPDIEYTFIHDLPTSEYMLLYRDGYTQRMWTDSPDTTDIINKLYDQLPVSVYVAPTNYKRTCVVSSNFRLPSGISSSLPVSPHMSSYNVLCSVEATGPSIVKVTLPLMATQIPRIEIPIGGTSKNRPYSGRYIQERSTACGVPSSSARTQWRRDQMDTVLETHRSASPTCAPPPSPEYPRDDADTTPGDEVAEQLAETARRLLVCARVQSLRKLQH